MNTQDRTKWKNNGLLHEYNKYTKYYKVIWKIKKIDSKFHFKTNTYKCKKENYFIKTLVANKF